MCSEREQVLTWSAGVLSKGPALSHGSWWLWHCVPPADEITCIPWISESVLAPDWGYLVWHFGLQIEKSIPVQSRRVALVLLTFQHQSATSPISVSRRAATENGQKHSDLHP